MVGRHEVGNPEEQCEPGGALRALLVLELFEQCQVDRIERTARRNVHQPPVGDHRGRPWRDANLIGGSAVGREQRIDLAAREEGLDLRRQQLEWRGLYTRADRDELQR